MFFQNELEFLGHLISSEGIKPTQSRVRVIQEAPAPQNRQELQSFLGMVTYNSKFIPALFHTLHPLHQLLHKNNPWVWKAQHQKAFVAAKQLLCEGSMLVHYDVKKPKKLFCDASAYGLGACLAHVMQNGDVRPITYASWKLTGPEQNFAQIE